MLLMLKCHPASELLRRWPSPLLRGDDQGLERPRQGLRAAAWRGRWSILRCHGVDAPCVGIERRCARTLLGGHTLDDRDVRRVGNRDDFELARTAGNEHDVALGVV